MMNRMKNGFQRVRILGATALIIATIGLILPAGSAFAAAPAARTSTPVTVLVTQAQINANPRVTTHNPRYTNVSITLLAGQAQVNSTYTDSKGTAIQVVSLWSPVIRAGRVDWVFVSATADGKPTSAYRVRDHRFGLQDVVNDTVHQTIKSQYNTVIYRDTAVTVSPNGVSVNANAWVKGATPTPTASAS